MPAHPPTAPAGEPTAGDWLWRIAPYVVEVSSGPFISTLQN